MSTETTQVRERGPLAPDFDPMGDDYYRDPARHFADVRGDSPTFFFPYLNAWIVTRRADAEMILPDWQKFSSASNAGLITVPEKHAETMPAELISRILVGSDPQGHTIARRVAQKAFLQPRMDALQPEIEARAHRIIDRIEADGGGNLMDAYCLELTTQTLMALMDLSAELEPMMRQLRDDFFQVLASAQEPLPEPRRTEVWDRYVAAQLVLRDIVRERRESAADDLISVMARDKGRDGNYSLSEAQIALHLGEFSAAGTDTTAQAMANAVIFLTENPAVLENAKADGLWQRVFDETVRRRPSSTFASRRANVDVTIGGADIKAGDMIWIALSAVNTDPEYYDRPFEFDIHREDPRDHLAFTKGRHTCLGQPLARVQGSTGLHVLYERLPSLRPAKDWGLDFIRMALLPVRRSLDVEWDVAAAAPQHAVELPADPAATLELRVSECRQESEGVLSLTLEDPAGAPLPAWTPGSHIDVHVGGFVRQYSLCTPGGNQEAWRVGVLKEEAGRGGSRAIHETVRAGGTVTVSQPRNNFVLQPAGRYVFIAGGIGITPILAMVEQAEREGAEWTLVYGGRSRSTMAFLDELEGYGDRVRFVPEDTDGRVDFGAYLAEVRPDTLIYCCGPEPLLNVVEKASSHWPSGSLHVERFVAKDIDTTGDVAFEVEFVDSGVTLTVPADKSILEVAEAAGLPALSSCNEGTCGTCETPVISGRPDHRDSILTDDEKESSESMFICVSRSQGGCPLKLAL
ncbi:cytochrome P450/oxidoreductase [Arthrobacter sp. Marseille-P9274]|uniref:cytochrome P450/oxidoreductase n=1 Tax=Arthrobacter sp. Marseille-P9274 TaxID=2866572 RepID=UPI0021C876F1|nr:cytochrome P450/oxidoreductase [Arthrobacter sp. Marseille-P9274]